MHAPERGVGGVLSQRFKRNSMGYPPMFFSFKMTPADCNYNIGNRELLHVKLASMAGRHTSPVIYKKNLEYIKTAM